MEGAQAVQNTLNDTENISKSGNSGFSVRPRINALLASAVKKPLTIVCAGMGCGKTLAVSDFTQECGIPAVWIQLSRLDNDGTRFWDVFVHAISQINAPIAADYKKLGFPDSEEKIHKYFDIQDRIMEREKFIIVFDDVHLISSAPVLNFIEQAINKLPENRSAILICRELTNMNFAGLMIRDKVSMITESDLNFTESELNQFLLGQGLWSETHNLHKIYQDTNGWAFIINFVARILKKTPGYSGYAQRVIKQDISQLIEAEAWNVISDKLRRLLLRFSLTDHRSAELAFNLTEGDESLISELKQQNAFIQFDRFTDSFYIHRLFLEFIYAKQPMLTDEERRQTYRIIADWCVKNDFIGDSLFYLEKLGDYESIMSILFASPVSFLEAAAQQISEIFERAPAEIFDRVDYSAAMHIHSLINLDKRQEAMELARFYEEKYLLLPEENTFRNRMLGCIYYYRGILRITMSTEDDRYDFDECFAKLDEYLKNAPINPGCWYQHAGWLWTGLAGSARAGAPQEFLSALTKSVHYLSNNIYGLVEGMDDLCKGELHFHQGDVIEAEACLLRALEKARKHGLVEIANRALFYIMRISVFQGDYTKFDRAYKDLEGQYSQNDYSVHFMTCDVVFGWYYYILTLPDGIPDWVKENFTYSAHSHAISNIGNYIKAKYRYMIKDYDSLLAFFSEKRQQTTILYERVELLVMEACVHHKMENNEAALEVLKEAYETAAPNNIIIPFIELGRDMRALISAAGSVDCGIPQEWLKNIKLKASAYSRNIALIVFDYIKTNMIGGKIILTARESVVLQEMYNGFSNSEIAVNLNLSVNTVKMHISSIYNKLGARNKADIFRIAAENGLL